MPLATLVECTFSFDRHGSSFYRLASLPDVEAAEYFGSRNRSVPSLKVTTSTAPESRRSASSAICLVNSTTVIGFQPSCSSPIPWNVTTCQHSDRIHPSTSSFFEISRQSTPNQSKELCGA